MTLVAPSHLRGRMLRHIPKAIKEERLAWIKARRDEGYTQAPIAAALGIDRSTVSSILHDYGASPKRTPLLAKRVNHIGLRLGRLSTLYDRLPQEMREALAVEAARMRGSIEDAIVSRLAAGDT